MKNQWLSDIIRPIVVSLGYEFWGVQYIPQGKYSLLRIYIDSEDGVGVDDCQKVSGQVGAVLEVEDPIRNHYVLEVSSPGLQRTLFTLEHYQRYTGHEVSVKMQTSIENQLENQRNFKGKLIKVTDDNLTLEMDTGQVILPINGIEKARLLD